MENEAQREIPMPEALRWITHLNSGDPVQGAVPLGELA